MNEYPSLTSLAYFAGLIDGEGYLQINKFKSINNKYPYEYRGTLRIAMCNKEVMDWLIQNIGGHYIQPKNLPSGREIWAWNMYSTKAADMLEKALPFIVVKNAQAKIFIDFIRATAISNTGKKGLPIKNYLLREEFYLKMKEANKW